MIRIKICKLVPFRALESQMTTVRVIVKPSGVLSSKLVLLRVKNIFESRLSNEILVPFRVFFENL